VIPRRQPPAFSPISNHALMRGVNAALCQESAIAARVQAAEIVRSHLQARKVLITNSGTAALTLALRSVYEVSGSRPIALPAFCCYDVASAACGAGVPAVLYDVDPTTLSPHPRSLKSLQRYHPGAIVVVHLFGIPIDVSQVRRDLGETRTVVIEDAAQGSGAQLRQRPLGAHGDIGILSFGRGKGITAGSGGALVLNEPAQPRLVESIVGQAQTEAKRGFKDLLTLQAQRMLVHPARYWLPAAIPQLHLGETVYKPPRPISAASRAACAVLCESWELAARESRVRARYARRFLEALHGLAGFTPIRTNEAAQPGYVRLPLRYRHRDNRQQALESGRRLGIARTYPRVLADLAELTTQCVNRSDPFPGARRLAEELITLPVHSLLTERDASAIETWMRTYGR